MSVATNCHAKMYAAGVACRLVSHGEYADGRDGQLTIQTDARLLYYAFYYGSNQCNNNNNKT